MAPGRPETDLFTGSQSARLMRNMQGRVPPLAPDGPAKGGSPGLSFPRARLLRGYFAAGWPSGRGGALLAAVAEPGWGDSAGVGGLLRGLLHSSARLARDCETGKCPRPPLGTAYGKMTLSRVRSGPFCAARVETRPWTPSPKRTAGPGR
jgi:hypothetical protein